MTIIKEKEIQKKKIFISYSWTNDKIIDWVRDELATRLVSDYGIDVVLDQWDLKEGHDVYHFMESMVTDESIDKVLVVCDKGYKEKADNRLGGAGTETQIITPNVYSQAKQEKFIPIVYERDDEHNSFIPVFMSSRKYIDLSSEELFIENLEQLARTIYEAPQHRNPAFGKVPVHFFQEEVVNTSGLDHVVKQIKNDLSRGRQEGISSKMLTYKDKFVSLLEEFFIEKGERNSVEMILELEKQIDNMDILKNSYIEFLVMLIPEKMLAADFVIDFFEVVFNKRFEIKDTKIGNRQSFFNSQLDQYKFLNYEIFLYTTATLMKYEEYSILNEIVEARYFLYQISNVADKIVLRTAETPFSKNDIIGADLLLHYLTTLKEKGNSWSWFPRTYIYGEYMTMDLFKKMESNRHLEKIFPLFEVSNTEELKQLLSTYHNPNPRGYAESITSIPSIESHIKIEDIGSYR
ncbi:toll/interleukin-1 receptor domain-containing protein [Terribacillus halophilus]|uniref:toll/interleukin-1 receptor domain-containing protein n=1 Tax=Terribacillus halophilus TaxID=361279 RepID=UPI0039823863